MKLTKDMLSYAHNGKELEKIGETDVFWSVYHGHTGKWDKPVEIWLADKNKVTSLKVYGYDPGTGFFKDDKNMLTDDAQFAFAKKEWAEEAHTMLAKINKSLPYKTVNSDTGKDLFIMTADTPRKIIAVDNPDITLDQFRKAALKGWGGLEKLNTKIYNVRLSAVSIKEEKLMKVTKEEILSLKKRIAEINSVPLSDIETDIDIKDSLEDLKFTGLDNYCILKIYAGE